MTRIIKLRQTKMLKYIIAIFFSFICQTILFGQNFITISKIDQPKKERKIFAERIIEFTTIDSIVKNRIVLFKANNFLILDRKQKRETKKIYLNKEKTDSTTNTYVTNCADTVNIQTKNIINIKYRPHQGKRWAITFTYLAALSVISTVSIPLNAINRGKDGAIGSAIFVGALMVLTIPPALIGNRKTNYDTRNAWKFN